MIRVCCAVIVKNNKILAVQRSKQMSHPLKWEFPGGKIQEGELEEACIKRELQEELKISISIHSKLPSIFHSYPERSIELIPFIVYTTDDPILEEHADLRWLEKTEIQTLDWVEADIEIVNQISTTFFQ